MGTGLLDKPEKAPLGVFVMVSHSPTSGVSEVPFHLIDPGSENWLKSADSTGSRFSVV